MTTTLDRTRYLRASRSARRSQHVLDNVRILLVNRAEALTQNQAIYTYLNSAYLGGRHLAEGRFIGTDTWHNRCRDLGEPEVPWEWSTYPENTTALGSSWSNILLNLANYGFSASKEFKSNEVNTIFRIFFRIAESCMTVAFEVPNYKADELMQKICRSYKHIDDFEIPNSILTQVNDVVRHMGSQEKEQLGEI